MIKNNEVLVPFFKFMALQKISKMYLVIVCIYFYPYIKKIIITVIIIIIIEASFKCTKSPL